MTSAPEDEVSKEIAGRHRYIRGRKLNFDQVLKDNRSTPDGSPCYLHIYCDELCGSLDDTTLKLDRFDIQYIHVFARSFLTDLAPKGRFCFAPTTTAGKPATFHLIAFYDVGPVDVALSLSKITDLNNTDQLISKNDTNAGQLVFAGLEEFAFAKGKVSTVSWDRELTSTPEGEFASLANFVPGFAPLQSNLASLLADMFSWAGELIFSKNRDDQAMAKSMFRYIVQCSRSAPSQAVLCTSAERILSRLELPKWSAPSGAFTDARQRFDVPILSLESYENSIVPTLDLVEKADALRESLLKNQALSDQMARLENHLSDQLILLSRQFSEGITTLREGQVDGTRKVLESLALSIGSFTVNNGSAEEAVSAVQDVERKNADILVRANNVTKSYAEMSENINDLFEDAELIGERQDLKNCIKLVGTATKALAGMAEGDFSGIADFVEEGIDSINHALDSRTARAEFQEAANNFRSKLLTLLREMETAKGAKAEFITFPSFVGEIRELSAKQKLRSLCAYPLDYYGLTAKWRDFQIDVNRVFKDMRDALAALSKAHEDDANLGRLDGLDACADAIEKLIVGGTTVLDTERHTHERVIAYLRVYCEAEERKQVQGRIRNISSSLNSTTFSGSPMQKKKMQIPMAFTLLPLAQEVRNASFQIFTALFDCVLSYVYRFNLSDWPSGFSVNASMTTSQFKAALAQLKEMSTKSSEKQAGLLNAPRPVTVSFNGSILEPFKQSGVIQFMVPVKHPALAGYYNLRTLDVYATFTSGSEKSLSNVEYMISVGPHFLDKDPDGRPLYFTISPFTLRKIDKDGSWAEGNFIRPPPCCMGELMVLGRKNLDLSKITEVSISFNFKGNTSKALAMSEGAF